MKVILAATDGSEGATAALREAADRAVADGAKLLVLTVTARGHGVGPTSDALREYASDEHLGGRVEQGRLVVAEDILAEAKEILSARRGLDASYLLRAGDAVKEILACAREQSADAIYLGSRGADFLGELLLGSVSSAVSRAAGCSVKVVAKK